MGFLSLFKKENASKEVAKDRLKLVLIHDRCNVSQSVMDDIRKRTYLNKGVILDHRDYENGEFINSKLLSDEGEVILSGERDKLKSYKVPIIIDDNKDYLLSFYISIDENVNSAVRFDFYSTRPSLITDHISCLSFFSFDVRCWTFNVRCSSFAFLPAMEVV